ncbi:DICT sensory domain-containing protein [Nocardioides solisilvae]|uniref:DICT sensory domain-containing protein n=1 Tax=Nocardioides solisilvae TaxID=1542435 RepID=UPI000D748E45|nr:DICT sensory domain-containing protein [Nocardioides solisilvae]
MTETRVTDDFSIGTLAQRTGVTTNVLRTWEHRFGFPAGRRTASGHRRFTDADAALVAEVLEARERGVPLQLAVEGVVQRTRQASEESVHAVLVREFPDLRPRRLSRGTLIAASHAIEDEVLARADRSLVLGTFQRGSEFARSEHRWDELARTATWAAVLAGFDGDLVADPAGRPARCHLADDSALRREWTVVALSPTFAAVLAAWEVPSRPGEPATYESVVTMRRGPALAAARVLVGAARSAGATPPPAVDELLGSSVAVETPVVDADRVLLRVLERVDAQR